MSKHNSGGYLSDSGAFWVRRYGSAWGVYDKRNSDMYGGELSAIVRTLAGARAAIAKAEGK